MKKNVVVLILFVALIAAGLLVSSTPEAMPAVMTSQAVDVPTEINDAIGIGIAAMMTMGLAYLFKITGLDLRGFATPLASAISLFVVGELQNVINVIPEVYDPWLNMGFKILVILIGSVGLLFMTRRSDWNEDGSPLIVFND